MTAKQVEEMVKRERELPLIIGFYATWCGPCVHMAQELEMVHLSSELTFQEYYIMIHANK